MRLDTLRLQNNRDKRGILAKLESLQVLNGLSTKQRVKLSNHVLMIGLHYGLRDRIGPDEQRVNMWFKRGPGQLRRLRSKVDKLRADLDDLREYAASIGVSGPNPDGNVYLASALDLEFGLHDHLAEIATAFQKLQVPPDTIFNKVPGHRMSADDPTTEATRVLFEFFTAECGVKASDASARIAKIENAMWRKNIRADDPDSYTPDRSSAILKRLRRHPRSPSR